MIEQTQAMAQLPQYQCHKKVWALKITNVQVGVPSACGDVLLHFEGSGFNTRRVHSEWYAKHSPQVGGYWVQYEGGYESYSPADVFEAGYTLVDHAAINRGERDHGENED